MSWAEDRWGFLCTGFGPFCGDVEARGFDVCIVDTAAGLFGATADVLSAATAVVVPQQAEPLGIRSVPKMLEALARMRIVNPKLTILGVVLTMLQKDLAESRDTAEALRKLLPSELVPAHRHPPR